MTLPFPDLPPLPKPSLPKATLPKPTPLKPTPLKPKGGKIAKIMQPLITSMITPN